MRYFVQTFLINLNSTQVLADPIPEVRVVAARALGSLIRGMGEENFPDLVPWLLETLKSNNNNVERSGAAQGLSEVIEIMLKNSLISLSGMKENLPVIYSLLLKNLVPLGWYYIIFILEF